MNEHLIKSALRANEATLGFHWIYDREYLLALSQTQSLLNQAPTKEHYEKANLSFFAYEEKDQFTVQGHILKWLFKAVRENKSLTKDEFKAVLLKQFMPGGHYTSYTESYIKKMVYNELAKSFNQPTIPMDDDQLPAFIPYMVFKWLKSTEVEVDVIEKASEFSSLFTNRPEYEAYFKMLDKIIETTTLSDIPGGLKKAIPYAPKDQQENLNQAFIVEDVEYFIKNYSGTACNYHEAISLIYYILIHTRTYREALELNVRLGGASADRVMLLAFLYTYIEINSEEPDG